MSDAPRTINALGKWSTEKIATVACVLLVALHSWLNHEQIDAMRTALDEERALRQQHYRRLQELIEIDISQDERLAIAAEKLVVLAAEK